MNKTEINMFQRQQKIKKNGRRGIMPDTPQINTHFRTTKVLSDQQLHVHNRKHKHD